MTPLWDSSSIAEAVKGTAQAEFTVSGISIDSRTLKKGDLFIALKGPNFDGHEFIDQAMKKGAAGILSEKAVTGQPIILVPDIKVALQDLGRASRARAKGKMLAVTGSVGKTSTKEMLREVGKAFGSIHASEGNLNNHWGVPLSLARMPRATDFGIFELGMNHAGEIEPLSQMVRPHLAIITWVAAAHLEFFASIADIARAKAEIFAGIEPDGACILPADNEHFGLLREIAKERRIKHILSFGSAAHADIRLLDYRAEGEGAMISADICGHKMLYRLAAPGRHLAVNSLAVLGAAPFLHLNLEKAAASLSGFTALAGRGKKMQINIKGGTIALIDEAYNASPASMQAALQSLVERGNQGRVLAVLGDMRELGPTSDQLHAQLIKDIAEKPIDKVYCCGPHMKALWSLIHSSQRGAYAADSNGLIDPLLKEIRPGDLILIKGSLGTKMAPIVEAIKAMGEERGAHVI